MDNPYEHIQQRIIKAYDIVRSAQITEAELQREAFIYALNALAPAKASPSVAAATAKPVSSSTDSIHEHIASALNVSLDIVELIYDVDKGVMTLNIPPRLLPDSTSAAMRDVAVLLTVGRKHANLGASTPFDFIRTVCEDLGKLDKKNFAAAMTSMKPRLTTTGKGAERELVPKRPADDMAKDIIDRFGQALG